jgi:hypothetical protein
MTIYTAMMSVTDNLVVLSFFEMVRALFLYAVSVAVILCCYQYRLKNACYVCVFGYTLQHMTLLVYYLVCYYFVPGGNSAARILLFYLVYSSVYVAEYLLLRNREDAVNIENTTMIIQSVIFLFCSVILSVLSYNYIVSNEALVGTPAVFVVSMFGVVMCVNIIIGLLDSFQGKAIYFRATTVWGVCRQTTLGSGARAGKLCQGDLKGVETRQFQGAAKTGNRSVCNATFFRKLCNGHKLHSCAGLQHIIRNFPFCGC